MKEIQFSIRPKSKAILGFDDTSFMLSGCFINSFIVLGALYKKFLFEASAYRYALVFMGIFILIFALWYLMRLVYLKIVGHYPGYIHRFKRLPWLPLVIMTYFLATLVWEYLFDPLFSQYNTTLARPKLKIELITGLFLVLVDLGIYETLHAFVELRNSKIKQAEYQKELALLQLRGLKQQTNPDFLFKNLKSLETLITKDRKKAKIFLHLLSRTYKTILEYSEKELITVDQELEHTKNFKHLFEAANDVPVHIQNQSIAALDRQLVPLSLQLVIETFYNLKKVDNKILGFTLNITNKEAVISCLSEQKDVTLLQRPQFKYIWERFKQQTEKEIIISFEETQCTVRLPLIG